LSWLAFECWLEEGPKEICERHSHPLAAEELRRSCSEISKSLRNHSEIRMRIQRTCIHISRSQVLSPRPRSLGPAFVYAAVCIGIAISFWALLNDTHATPAISGALGSVGVGQRFVAHLHVVRIVHDALYHVLQHCVARKYRIHLRAAVLFLRVRMGISGYNAKFSSLSLTFSTRMRCRKPRYFFSKRYKSFISCVFSCSIWAVVISVCHNF